jgi:Spy/CpxP family protein refolding chaperone
MNFVLRGAIVCSVIAFHCAVAVSAQPDLVSADKKTDVRKDPVLIYREAGASEEQESKIRQIAQEFEQVAKVRVERLKNLSKQLREMSFQPAIDEVKALSLQNDINELQATLNTERIKLMLKIRSVLSQEQNEKLVSLMRERQKQDPSPREL